MNFAKEFSGGMGALAIFCVSVFEWLLLRVEHSASTKENFKADP
jgi:hypothetical protein